MLKTAAVMIGAVLALGAIAAPADAAKSKILGKSGGFTYARDTETLPGPGFGQGQASARCPKNTTAISGGASISSRPAVSFLADTSKPDLREWFANAWHLATDVSKVQSFAICTKKLGQYFDAGQAFPAAGGTLAVTNSVSCPSGNVVGGGTKLGGQLPDWSLHSMYPLDELDEGEVPNDAWRVTVLHRDGTSPSTMEVDAFCLTGLVPEYVTKDVPLSDDPTKSVKAKCPAGTVVLGGGAFASGGAVDSHLVKTIPYDAKDKDKIPDDGWSAKFANEEAAMLTYQAIAICR